jgi:H+/gluconate symporter-like permease
MIGIFVGLVLLMVLAYRGFSIIWIAPLCALIVAVTGGLDILSAYKEFYMEGFAGFVQAWFPVFMLGAIFGKVMDDSGAALSVARWVTNLLGTRRAILAVVIGCAVLTYGGVSLFVVVFAMYPLSVALFKEANLSRTLIPGTIALGSFTFTMTAIPGSPQIQNLIPMQYFDTTPMAAPLMGMVGALIMFGAGMFWLTYRAKQMAIVGETYIETEELVDDTDASYLPNALLSSFPLIIVIVLLNVFQMDIVVALTAGILFGLAIGYKRIQDITGTINTGASESVMALINTSAAVGFGTVVRLAPGFEKLTSYLTGIGGNPLISEAVAVNVLAGATGSAAGGMGIALEALGERFIEMSIESGIPLEAFHRIASMAAGGLDTLPHNGAVLTLLTVTAMSHKQSYKDIFVVGTLIPILAVAVCILLAGIGMV